MQRTALITGAGRNIGQDVAQRFARAGYAVVVNARSADSVERVATGIVAGGGRAIGVPADVTVREQVRDLFGRADQEFGGVDVVVHCAVTRVDVHLEEMTLEQWRAPFATVLDGAFHCLQAALPHMKDQGWGRFIGIGGVSGQRGSTRRVGVVSAKSGLMGFVKAAGTELAPYGITANVVSPGSIATEQGDFTTIGDREAIAPERAALRAQIPLKRQGQPREISAACLYLASEDAGYVTGQTLAVNGGLYM